VMSTTVPAGRVEAGTDVDTDGFVPCASARLAEGSETSATARMSRRATGDARRWGIRSIRSVGTAANLST
jgi:hypothetical protein